MTFHHVGLVFRSRHDAEAAAWEMFDEGLVPWERVDAFQCWCAFLLKHPAIELVAPDEGSPLSRYVTASPTALHHLAFSLAPAAHPSRPLLFPAWATGARGLTVTFGIIEHGLLIEYVRVP